uniref:CSON014312 protein n=1 Tax=Culicoides sonorensis TaxID=179676 RepID=A0A336LMF2_CULSO
MYKTNRRTLPKIQYSSASDSYKDPDPLASLNLQASIGNSHVEDLIKSKWAKELPKSFQPYNDQKFNRVFNLPPNEVAFMGGLGGKKGNARSTLHTDRPTEVQKIFNMRTGNRGIFNLTENPRNTQSLTQKRPPILNMSKQVKSIVDKVWRANNFEDKVKSSDSDSVYLTRRIPRQIPPPEPLPTLELINDVRDRLDKMFKIPDEFSKPRETFTEWAIKEREKFKQRRAAKAVKQEKTITETLSMDQSSDSDTDSRGTEYKIKRKTKKRDKIQHISGYMYGEFTKIPKQGKKTTKFGIPLSMLDRAKEEMEKQKEKDKQLRRARIAHMKLPLFFEDENSGEDDVVETVKALTLIRTPFLRLPKIKTQKKRRRDRLRSKYLKQDRLKRITMLLYDRSYDPNSKESLESMEKSLEKDEPCATKEIKSEKDISIQKKKYINFIKDSYEQQIKGNLEEKDVKEEDGTSFEQFRVTEDFDLIRTKSSTPQDGTESVKAEIEALPPFKTKKNEKFSKSDERTGPYYIDPEQMEKMNDPMRFKTRSKYYTSLMRGRYDTRDRLQVTGTDFNDVRSFESHLNFLCEVFYPFNPFQESCGPKQYSHRLITEFDNFYIHELRHHKSIRKFCPKSDIINLRNSMRKKFVDFYMQENLQHLMHKQAKEKKYLDDIDRFATICKPLFQKRKYEYFQHMTQQIESVAPAIEQTQKLMNEKDSAMMEFENVNDKVIAIEIKFEHFMSFMQFYKRLIPPEWKMDNMEKYKAYEETLNFLSSFFNQVKNRSESFVTLNKELTDTPLQILEADPQIMHIGIHSIKFRVKGLLSELVQTMWLYDKILLEKRRLASWFPLQEDTMRKNISFQDKKLSFVEERNYILKYDIQEIANKSLKRCVKNPIIRKVSAICDQLYKSTIPEHLQNRHQQDEPVVDKFAFIQDYVLDLLHELDEIPIEIVKDATKEVKIHTTFIMQQAQKTCIQQNRFELMKKQLKFHFTVKKQKKNRRRTPSPFSPRLK